MNKTYEEGEEEYYENICYLGFKYTHFPSKELIMLYCTCQHCMGESIFPNNNESIIKVMSEISQELSRRKYDEYNI